MFVREGGIVPMLADGASSDSAVARSLNHAPKPGQTMTLEVRHYGRDESVFNLYDDDGETVDYERGKFCHVPLRVTRAAAAAGLQGTAEPAEGDYASTYRVGQWRFMTEEGTRQ
jgi:alpha-D-xyloside xylohydrolase